jgi:RNA polymerase sigma-70 factor, ECF subfamily
MAAVAGHGEVQRDVAQALYERYHRSVYRYALSQVRSPEDAEDATQNTFLRAFSALQRGVVPENEAAWLFKIAHNVCLSSKLAWLRRRRVETPRDLEALPVAPAAREGRRDELFGLDDALAAMPPRLREAFVLREWQGLSYEEIAQRLDTSHSAVESLIFRARRMLATQLEAPLKKARQALGLGQLLGALRGLAGGGSLAVKGAALAVAVAVAAGATVAARPLHHHHAPAAPLGPALSPLQARPSAPAAAIISPQGARVIPKTHRSTTGVPSNPGTAAPQQPFLSPPATPTAGSAQTGSAQAGTPAPQNAAPAPPAAATAGPPPGVLPLTAPPPAGVDPQGVLQQVLPDVPTAPAVPASPAAPALPTGPALPATQTVPATPTVPAAPSLPAVPTVPAVTLPQPPLP